MSWFDAAHHDRISIKLRLTLLIQPLFYLLHYKYHFIVAGWGGVLHEEAFDDDLFASVVVEGDVAGSELYNANACGVVGERVCGGGAADGDLFVEYEGIGSIVYSLCGAAEAAGNEVHFFAYGAAEI